MKPAHNDAEANSRHDVRPGRLLGTSFRDACPAPSFENSPQCLPVRARLLPHIEGFLTGFVRGLFTGFVDGFRIGLVDGFLSGFF
jgi:hypothetical protein